MIVMHELSFSLVEYSKVEKTFWKLFVKFFIEISDSFIEMTYMVE